MPNVGIDDKGVMSPTCHLPFRALYGHKRDMAGNNIAELRKAAGLSQTQLAEAIGTTLNNLGKLERGDRRLNQDWINKIAGTLRVPAHKIIEDAPLDEVPDAPIASSASAGEVVPIIKLDLKASMGPGTLLEEWAEQEIVQFDGSTLRDLTRTPAHRIRLISGVGDSMRPTIQEGDQIMVDTTQRGLARQDGIYWISLFGAANIKRLRAVARDRILVISDNPDIENQEVEAEDLQIEGRVIWVSRGF